MFEIIKACQFLLKNYLEASNCRDYLNSRLNHNSQDLFQFGYFPDINNIQALISIIGKDILFSKSLLYSKDIQDSQFPRTAIFSFFENYPLIMPYKDAYGKIIGIVGRSLSNDKKIPKYKNTSFKKSKHLFGLFENKTNIVNDGLVYIAEGQFDVIKSKESGMQNIVSLGSSNMSAYQFSVITRYTNNICLLLDNDEAGEKGRKRILDKFGKYANVHNFYIPEPYKDIDEYFSSNNYKDLSFVMKR